MNPTDRIKELNSLIEKEKEKIANCSHSFSDVFYDPTKEMAADGFKLVGHGSDPWPEATGFHEITVDRWTKKCIYCGYEIHATSQDHCGKLKF